MNHKSQRSLDIPIGPTDKLRARLQKRRDACDCTVCAYAKKHPQLNARRCWERAR